MADAGPQGFADEGQRFGKSGVGLGIPGGCAKCERLLLLEQVGGQGHPSEESVQGQCGEPVGEVGPLALGF